MFAGVFIHLAYSKYDMSPHFCLSVNKFVRLAYKAGASITAFSHRPSS